MRGRRVRRQRALHGRTRGTRCSPEVWRLQASEQQHPPGGRAAGIGQKRSRRRGLLMRARERKGVSTCQWRRTSYSPVARLSILSADPSRCATRRRPIRTPPGRLWACACGWACGCARTAVFVLAERKGRSDQTRLLRAFRCTSPRRVLLPFLRFRKPAERHPVAAGAPFVVDLRGGLSFLAERGGPERRVVEVVVPSDLAVPE